MQGVVLPKIDLFLTDTLQAIRGGPELQKTLGSRWSSWYTGFHSRPGEAG